MRSSFSGGIMMSSRLNERSSFKRPFYNPRSLISSRYWAVRAYPTFFYYFANNIAKRFLWKEFIDISHFFWEYIRSWLHVPPVVSCIFRIGFPSSSTSSTTTFTNAWISTFSFVVSNNGFLFAGKKNHSFTFCSRTDLGNVIQTKNHILRWNWW